MTQPVCDFASVPFPSGLHGPRSATHIRSFSLRSSECSTCCLDLNLDRSWTSALLRDGGESALKAALSKSPTQERMSRIIFCSKINQITTPGWCSVGAPPVTVAVHLKCSCRDLCVFVFVILNYDFTLTFTCSVFPPQLPISLYTQATCTAASLRHLTLNISHFHTQFDGIFMLLLCSLSWFFFLFLLLMFDQWKRSWESVWS